MANNMHKGYVRLDNGKYAVQIPDEESPWGFYLATDDATYDGGFGLAESWEAVPARSVSSSARKRLSWLLEE